MTGNMNSNDSTPQTGTSSTRFSRASTVLTIPVSPTLSISLHEKLESLPTHERERQSFGSDVLNEVPAWDRSGLILTPSEDGFFIDYLAIEWQAIFPAWDRSGSISSSFNDDYDEFVEDHQTFVWGGDFIDESASEDHENIEWGGDFIEEIGSPEWDVSGVTDPRYIFTEDTVEANDNSAWDVSGVTHPRYLVAASWDHSGVYLTTSTTYLVSYQNNMQENESAMLGQQYLDTYLNPPNSHKISYYLENLPEELELDWQQYLIQSMEGKDGILVSESAYLENFNQFIDQLELPVEARVNSERTLSIAFSDDDVSDGDSFYSAHEDQTTHAELFKPRLLSELVESGRRSTDNLLRGRSPERHFVISEEVKRPHSLGDIIAMHPAVRNRSLAQFEADLSLGLVVTRRPGHTPAPFHVSIEPMMSGGRSSGNSRPSSRSSGILPAGDGTRILEPMKMESEQRVNRMSSFRSKISRSNSRASKEYKPNMERLIKPDPNYIPSLGELKERPVRRKRFDKFREKIKFWRKKENSEVEA